MAWRKGLAHKKGAVNFSLDQLTTSASWIHTIHVKRINLVLDERILEETLRLSGERTYSKAVTRAMTEFVRWAKSGRILQLAGSGLWEGDLAEMRNDRPRSQPEPQHGTGRVPC